MSLDTALPFTLRFEGGYVNDPADPGGETRYGISKRAHPNEDITNLTLERAKEIYRLEYWNPVAAGLSEPLATAAFDAAVNCGVKRVKAWLTHTEGMDPVTAAKNLCEQRCAHYRLIMAKNPTLKKYRKGWFNRVVQLRKHLGIL